METRKKQQQRIVNNIDAERAPITNKINENLRLKHIDFEYFELKLSIII